MKVTDPLIRMKWIQEAKMMAPGMSEKTAAHLIQNTQWRGEQREAASLSGEPFITPSAASGVWQSNVHPR